MSEQNILNPTAGHILNPTYSIPHKDPQIISSWQPRSGRPSSRFMLARGRVFELHWEKVLFSTYEALEQWIHQYERGFFTFYWLDKNRYYSGQFLAEPQYEQVGNNQVNINATFVEIPGLAMFQYPSNWGVTSIFLEERDDFGNDLVKLTGTWERQTSNYILWSEQFDNIAWTKETNVTVTANTTADPNGSNTADTIATGVTAGVGVNQGFAYFGGTVRAGFQVTGSVWLKSAAGTVSVNLLISRGASDVETVNVTATTTWQRFSIAHSATFTGTTIGFFLIRLANAGASVFAWGAQVEFGAVATVYSQTTNVPALLSAPNSNASIHGGFAYWNQGTSLTDAAEWQYFGYGFRLWSYKGPDMGIVQVFLDGVSQGTVDLYAAAATASVVVLTVQNVSLGLHRVKLQPTNTKNAASLNFIVGADAIEVMR